MWCATPCKTAFRNPVRLAVVIWVLLGLLWPSSSVSAWVNAAPDDSPKPFPIGPIPLPPVSGSSRWYIPKGYNSGGTHANGNVYSLDFVLAKSDNTEDYPGTVGIPVISPVAGTVAWKELTQNLVAVRLDETGVDPDTGKTLYYYVTYGHLEGKDFEALQLTKRVEMNQNIGAVAAEAPPYGQHIHITLFSIPSKTYTKSDRVPLYCSNCPARHVDLQGGPTQSVTAWPPDGTFDQYKGWVVLASGTQSKPPTAAMLIATPHAAQNPWAYEGESVTFNGSASKDEDGTINSWEWDFGDGAKQTTGGSTVTHVYAKAGTYHASLKVHDNTGLISGPAAGSVVIRSPQQTTGDVDIVLLIDCSGSMTSNDPADLRKSAAKLLVQQARLGDRIGVVGFTDYFEIFAPLTKIESQATKTALQAAIDRAYANGGTSLSAGLGAAYSQLDTDKSGTSRRAVVLLTDGQGSYNNEAANFAAKGWRIYTVGLSSSHDAALLSMIAADTNGRYYNSPNSADLQKVYSDLAGNLTGRTSLFQEIFDLIQGTTKKVIRSIPGVPELNVTLFWPGSAAAGVSSAQVQAADARLQLTDPDGVVIDPADPLIQYQDGAAFVSYSIPNPKPGDWSFDIEAVNAASPMQFTLDVKTLDVAPPKGSILGPSPYVTSQQVLLELAAEDDGTAQSDLEYRLSPDQVSWSDWLPFATTHEWTFPDSQEVQYVFAQFRDTAGNVSDMVDANFMVDTTAPDTSILNVSGAVEADAPTVFEWTGSDNALEGDGDLAYSHMLVGVDTDWSPYVSGQTKVVYTGLPVGDYLLLVRARDYAGNPDPSPAELQVHVRPAIDKLYIPFISPSLQGSVPTMPSLPSAKLDQYYYYGPCQWVVGMRLTGFKPNSQVWVESNYSEYACKEQRWISSSWSEYYREQTDAEGNLTVTYLHQGTGSYNYSFTDTSGNNARLIFTTTP